MNSLQVLIVDDEPGITDFIAVVLQETYKTLVAGSVEQALQLLEKNNVDIIVSDLRMPGKDGLEFLAGLRKQGNKTPFILMSAHGDKDVVIEALRLGAFDYLEKPFMEDDVVFTVKRAAEQIELLNTLNATRLKMVQSAKMAALGELAGGVAHEINTPLSSLTFINDEIKLLVRDSKARSESVSELASEANKTIAKIADIVRNLLAFARSGENEPRKIVSVADIVGLALQLCREKLSNRGITLKVDPIPTQLKIECRSSELIQVLLNLISNAVDAVQNAKEKWIGISVHAGQDRIEIAITDSGTGIATEIRQHIFEPFFTTKGPSRGAGLGLSTAKGIVEAHGGAIFLNEQSSQTCFVLRLPVS